MKATAILIGCVLWCMTGFSQSSADAAKLLKLPVKCSEQEFPNKLSQTLADASELKTPKELHPAFYGCFDWHSSVHGHWSMVYLLDKFKDLPGRDSVIALLEKNLSRENILKETAYFSKKHEYSYERTYGWAWLLQLQSELDKSTQPYAVALAKNLQPLTDTLSERYISFLPKLLYPLRIGTHNNTAFGLSMAYDYARHAKNTRLQTAIESAARRFFMNDKNCPLSWEPSGTDFLSPCMEEVRLMEKILPYKEFIAWLRGFSPQLFNKAFTWQPAQVADRSDGHLVHLDGLNLSRAWTFYSLARKYPKTFSHLRKSGDEQFNFSYRKIFDGNYEGEHWLASFALYALSLK